MYKSICTKVTALPASTVETLIDSIKVPAGVTKCIAVGANFIAGGLGLTTLQNVSCKITLKSKDMTAGWAGDQEFLTGAIGVLTGGTPALNPLMHPTDIQVTVGGTIDVYGTADEADTIVPGIRAQLVFS